MKFTLSGSEEVLWVALYAVNADTIAVAIHIMITMRAAFQAQETHQQTVDKFADIFADQTLFLAVAAHPGVQPFLGKRQLHREFPCH
jgi:cation transport ATPase